MNLQYSTVLSFDLTNTTQNLELRNGIWYSKDFSNVSYPDEGYDICFEIEENSFWFAHRNQCIIEIIKNFTPEGIIFDVGGGNGYVARGLEKAGLKTVLVEPGLKGVLNAQSRGLTNIICATIEDAQLQEGSLDAIGIFDVLEHIEDDVAFLKQLNKYLASGNMLYISVPAYRFLWSEEDLEANHFRRYTLKSLEKVLLNAGYEMTYSTYIFSFLPIPIFLFRTLPTRLGLKKKEDIFKKHKKIHSSNKGIINSILEKLLNLEIKKIRNKKKIIFGGSCLVAARKISK